ncbi:hypothetical protein J6Q66_08425 [bacterium]|nr:hypothetical protein [bacterium]
MRISSISSFRVVKPLFKGEANKMVGVKKNFLKSVQTLNGQPIKRPLFR